MTSPPDASADWAVFLDVDGTLVEIADHPDDVRPSPLLVPILHHLCALLNGALALVSGREIAAVDRLLGVTDLATAGLHGLELRQADGQFLQTAGHSPALASARATMQSLVSAYPGLYLEDKNATIAVHYRNAPNAAELVFKTGRDLASASNGQLDWLHGKSVFELKPSGADKGGAVQRFMHEHPFLGRRPVYIGDDVTDEHAFGRVNTLDGVSIRVGDSATSLAAHTLANVDEVLAWLRQTAATIDAKNKARI